MSYISEILAFQGFVQDKSLSSGQIALWYALMYINNRSQWQEWFTVANKSLESNSGLSRQGILKARNALKQFGLLDFQTRGTKSTAYKLIAISNSSQSGCQNSSQNSSQDGCRDGCQNSSTLNRQDKNRQDKMSYPPISPETEIELPLNGNGSYSVSKEQAEEWKKLYPAVDIAQQLRNMKGWLDANPDRRKTKQGILRFITGWLSREQDKGSNRKISCGDSVSYDIEAFKRLGYDLPEVEDK